MTQPIAGACADRFGPGRVMLAGGLALAVCAALVHLPIREARIAPRAAAAAA